jgi:signal peptidase II
MMLYGGQVLLRLLSVAGFFFSLDQFTKMLVARRLPEGQSVPLASWIRIRHVTNGRGVLLYNPRVLLGVLAALFGGICLIVWQGYFFQHRAAQLGLGMALGGACSNACDQLRHHAVTDFLDLGWWPVFNLADVAITIGVTMALWFLH